MSDVSVPPQRGMRLSRRRLLQVGLGSAGVLATPGVGLLTGAPEVQASGSATVPFQGAHQAGVATPPPNHTVFAAVDVTTSSTATLQKLLKAWTADARLLTAGKPAATPESGASGRGAASEGEASTTGPAHLTITIGFGPTLFDKGRFAFSGLKPAQLAPLPAFRTDQLEAQWTGGDLMLQACADDQSVALNAIRSLMNTASGDAQLRWVQTGFLSPPAGGGTPRNLLGFKDGTLNVDTSDSTAMNQIVWVGSEGPAWFTRGSYLVVRRIGFKIKQWDATSVTQQENVIGRNKASGAPLGEPNEFSPLDLSARKPNGQLVIPANAHVRLADSDTILRRGYNFNGSSTGSQLDVGLIFICYQRSLSKGFIAIQNRLSQSDALSAFLEHIGSAVFALPIGVSSSSDYWGSGLFG